MFLEKTAELTLCENKTRDPNNHTIDTGSVSLVSTYFPTAFQNATEKEKGQGKEKKEEG